MADLTDLQSAETVKIAGANPSTGVEDNFMEVDSSGRITTKLNDGSGNSLTSTNTTLDSKQRLDVVSSSIDGYKETYSAGITGLVVANTPTDIFTITGSGTKTIRVLRVNVNGTQNTSAARDFVLIKRSTANTGGTSTNPTAVPHDSNNAAATATINAYTANPTLGTTVGTVRASRIALLATNVTNPEDRIEWLFGIRPSQSVVLRGTSQVLAVNLNGVTSSNNNFSIDVEWTEE